MSAPHESKSTGPAGTPPRASNATTAVPVAVRLLARLVPAELRDHVFGDAVEEYELRRRSHGRARALIWCCRQLLQPDLVRTVVIESMSLAAAGIAIGMVGGRVLGSSISAFLFAIRPSDSLTFVMAPMLLAIVALAASIVPARRAAKTDPMAALRAP